MNSYKINNVYIYKGKMEEIYKSFLNSYKPRWLYVLHFIGADTKFSPLSQFTRQKLIVFVRSLLVCMLNRLASRVLEVRKFFFRWLCWPITIIWIAQMKSLLITYCYSWCLQISRFIFILFFTIIFVMSIVFNKSILKTNFLNVILKLTVRNLAQLNK